jgi:ribonuclease HI
MALKRVKDLVECGETEARKVVLVLDSTYVVNSMTRYIHFWRQNYWLNAYGELVRNRRDLEELDSRIEELERDCGVSVKLWRVDREYNTGADREAKEAIRGHWRIGGNFV